MFLISAVLLIIRMHLLVCNLSQECIWLQGRALAQGIFLPTCPPVLGHPQTQHKGPEVCSPMVARHWPLRAPSFMVFGYKNGSTTFLKLIFQKFLENLTVGTLCKEKGAFLAGDGAWLTLRTKDADWMRRDCLGNVAREMGNSKTPGKGVCVCTCVCICVSLCRCVCTEISMSSGQLTLMLIKQGNWNQSSFLLLILQLLDYIRCVNSCIC